MNKPVIVKLSFIIIINVVLLGYIKADKPNVTNNESPVTEMPVAPTTLPVSVASIVEAISNVQKNISGNTNSKRPNIKVSGSVLKNETIRAPTNVIARNVTQLQSDSTERIELETATESIRAEDSEQNKVNSSNEGVSIAISSIANNSVITQNGTVAEDTDNHQSVDADILDPPAISIFSYEGVSQWINWAASMRDPSINPEGTASWPTIVARGLQSLFQYYNPFRRFMSRAIDAANTINHMSDVFKNREAVIAALLKNEISPDADSITKFVQKLEKHKISHKIASLQAKSDTAEDTTDVVSGPAQSLASLLGIPTIQEAAQTVDTALDQIFEPLDQVPATWVHFAGLFGEPFSGVLAAPLYVKIVNLILKGLYIAVILSWIPFSGIENFFIAPLPPRMDTYPGILRLFGLQALLGPEYIDEYDARLEDLFGDEDTPGGAADAAEAEAAAAEAGDGRRRFDDENESEDARKKRKTENFKEKVKKFYYNDLHDIMKPPPSHYGLRKFWETTSSPIASTSSGFAVIHSNNDPSSQTNTSPYNDLLHQLSANTLKSGQALSTRLFASQTAHKPLQSLEIAVNNLVAAHNKTLRAHNHFPQQNIESLDNNNYVYRNPYLTSTKNSNFSQSINAGHPILMHVKPTLSNPFITASQTGNSRDWMYKVNNKKSTGDSFKKEQADKVWVNTDTLQEIFTNPYYSTSMPMVSLPPHQIHSSERKVNSVVQQVMVTKVVPVKSFAAPFTYLTETVVYPVDKSTTFATVTKNVVEGSATVQTKVLLATKTIGLRAKHPMTNAAYPK